MKRQWFVFYQIRDTGYNLIGSGLIGPIPGSRETARNIKRLLEKINSELKVKVLGEESIHACAITRSLPSLLTEIKVTLQKMIDSIGEVAKEDKSLVQVSRQEIRRLEGLSREVVREY